MPARADGTGGAGLFTQRSSKVEQPTIKVSHRLFDVTLTLELTDIYTGRTFVARTSGPPTSITVPPGDYRVYVYGDDPTVRPNTGDATFRRHTEYEAVFTSSPFAGRIHLGD